MISQTYRKNGILNLEMSIIGYFTNKTYMFLAIWIFLISITTTLSTSTTIMNKNNNDNNMDEEALQESQQNLDNLCTQFSTLSECLQGKILYLNLLNMFFL